MKDTIPSCYEILTGPATNEYIENLDLLAGLSFISSALSICGTVSIIGFMVWRKIYCQQQALPLLHLSIADCMLSVLWISSSASYFSKPAGFSETTAISCFMWQLLTELTHLTTFFLTINYSFNVYLRMKDRTERVHCIPDARRFSESNIQSRVRRFMYCVCWVLPLVLMMPIVIFSRKKYISPCQKCVILLDVPRLEGDVPQSIKVYGFTILAITLASSMISILILYSLTCRLYWKAVPGFHTNQERRKLSNMQTRITVYIISFIICWGPALMLSSYKWHELGDSSNIEHSSFNLKRWKWLYISQSVLAPLQGFLNCLVYGWTRKSFRRASPHAEANHSSSRTSLTSGYQTPYVNGLPSIGSLEDSLEVNERFNASTPLPL